MVDPIDLGLVEAAAALAAGEISSRELVAAHLARAEATRDLNAWVTIDPDGAMAAAEVADDEMATGRRRGPLQGIPVGIKDLIDTAGLRTTYGSPRFVRHVPDADAGVVRKLRGAGAVILGKQATHEFAWGGRTDSLFYGPTHNPHDSTRVPGGSSGGGAAAVVSGTSLLAVGTDTAGSVRIPAALSGCVGFKPTRGWCPLDGIFPLAPSLDHVGLMARSVADVGLAFGVLAGSAEGDERVRPLSVGVLSQRSRDVLDDEVRAAYDLAIERIVRTGVETREVDDPQVDERAAANLGWILAEAEEIHREAFLAEPALYGADLAELICMGPVPAEDLDRMKTIANQSASWLWRTLSDVTVVIGPTEPIVAPRIGELSRQLAGQDYPIEFLLTRLTSVANVAGLPALSLPLSSEGLPVGLQVMGLNEATVLGVSRWLEAL